ncbi:BlaI/MecI/CopY family transcriptional regulator [Kribbella sp. DT2]|uniref:BlaI/MecI/CopY family transcriptional regulator n=1 Tax=Kribbella sp. DT2 TaxID=3393427 RepID=UPI003CEEE1DE
MRAFGDLEAAIMQVVWSQDAPVTVRTITDALNTDRQLAYTTVITVTERLRTKGWLRRTRVGRSFEYAAERSADAYTAQLMDDALAASADRSTALMRFAGTLDHDEVAALRAALDNRPTEPS